eukprot:g30702.t1
MMSDLASVPQWLPQTWDSSDAVHGHLVEASRALKEPGRFEEALQHFPPNSVQDLTRPHLSFSCLFPLFFSSLRLSDAPEHGTRGQIACCEDHISDAFTCCRALLESLASSFTDPPSDSPPEGCSRQRFVHELGAQAGVYLDMVRLGHAHRRKKTKVLSVAPSTPELSQAPDTPARLCGGLGLLTFSTLLDSEADFNTSVFAFCFVVGMHSSWSTLQVLCRPRAMRREDLWNRWWNPSSRTLQDGGSLRKKDPELWEAITGAQRDDDSSVDSSRNSSRRGSGRARDVRAQPMMELWPTAMRTRQRRKQLGKQISDASTTPATPSSGSELSLKQILQASTQERKLRDQMSNSVVEKRRLGLSAHPDLRIPRDVATPATARRDAAGQ